MPGLPAIWQAGLGQGVREYWNIGGFPSLQYSSTPEMDNGKSGSLDTKTQFMAVYSV